MMPPVGGTAFSVDETDGRRDGGLEARLEDVEGRRGPYCTGWSVEATAGDDKDRLRAHAPDDELPGKGTRNDFVDHVLTRGSRVSW